MKRNAVLRRLGVALLAGALIALTSAPVARACLNEYQPPSPAEKRHARELEKYQETIRGADDYLAMLKGGADEHVVSDEELEKLEEAAVDGDFRDRTNYAVALVRRGRPQQAVELLQRVEAEQPGEYIVAANLGTAYELTGNNSEALRWIRTGIDRNPDSHAATEWLHVKILEAKLKLADDPGWLAGNSVIGLDFGANERPAQPAGHVVDQFGLPKRVEAVQAALEYQLHERLGLVTAPDIIVADLLLDLGNLLTLADSPYKAARVYGLAVQYDPTRLELVGKRHAYLKQVGLGQIGPRPFDIRLNLRVAAAAVLGVVVLLAVIARIVRSRRMKVAS